MDIRGGERRAIALKLSGGRWKNIYGRRRAHRQRKGRGGERRIRTFQSESHFSIIIIKKRIKPRCIVSIHV